MSNKPKKFYWLKLEEKFFRQKAIKALRKMDKGAVYILIYEKMLIYSLDNCNKLYFDHVEESFVEEIALDIDEEKEDVNFTLDFLQKVGLVQFINDDELEFVQVDQLTGKEGESAKRMRKHRKNVCDHKENLCDENVTTYKEKEIDKDKEKEIDKDIDNNCESMSVDENFKKIVNLYEENMGVIYPANREWFLETSSDIEWQLFEKAIQICIDKNNMTPSYLKGIIKKWKKQKIHTLQEYNAKEMERLNKKSQDKNSKKNTGPKDIEVDEKMIAEIKAMEREMED